MKSIRCWGLLQAPEGTFLDLALGGYSQIGVSERGCGVTTDGRVTCFAFAGTPSVPQTAAPATHVAVGTYHVCALDEVGGVACACGGGSCDDPSFRERMENAPEGEFTQVVAGESFSCALRTSGDAICWGYLPGHAEEGPEDRTGPYRQLSAGAYFVCGVRPSGSVDCWGEVPEGAKLPPCLFSTIAAGAGHVCGLRDDGSVVCWGRDDHGQLQAPPGPFSAVGSGATALSTCGVRPTGEVVCWGAPTSLPP